MIISKTSWHYRLLYKLEIYHGDTLCRYFWQVVGALILCLGVVCIALIMLSPLLWLVPHTKYLAIMWTGLSIDVVLASIAGGTWTAHVLEGRGITVPDNLLVARIKAAKDKVCPIITFKDE